MFIASEGSAYDPHRFFLILRSWVRACYPDCPLIVIEKTVPRLARNVLQNFSQWVYRSDNSVAIPVSAVQPGLARVDHLWPALAEVAGVYPDWPEWLPYWPIATASPRSRPVQSPHLECLPDTRAVPGVAASRLPLFVL